MARMVTDRQVRRLFKLMQTELTQAVAAAKSGRIPWASDQKSRLFISPLDRRLFEGVYQIQPEKGNRAIAGI